MHIANKKKLLLITLFASCLSSVQADNATNSTPMSNAMSFAIQAGYIAGAVQGCGQDPTVFMARVNEALDKLAINPADKAFSMNNFQRITQQARITQANNHPIPCAQVMQDFRGLPIMQADYQQNVLNQLAVTTNDPPSNPQIASVATPPINNLAVQQPPNVPSQTINPPVQQQNNINSTVQNNPGIPPVTPNQNNLASQPIPAPNPYVQGLPNNTQQSYQAANIPPQQSLPTPSTQALPPTQSLAMAQTSAQPPPYNPRD